MAAPDLDLVIRGGIIVTADGRTRADVGVKNGRIERLGDRLTGAREIDAGGRFVLPGGVDPHVHLNIEVTDPSEPPWVDDYTSGSQAALAGGVTSVGNMSFVMPWETIADRVRTESALVAKQAIADVFFHTVVVTPNRDLLAEIPRAVAGGQPSMKIFMSLPTFDAHARDFARVMDATGGAGGITLIHCEDLATIECCTATIAFLGPRRPFSRW